VKDKPQAKPAAGGPRHLALSTPASAVFFVHPKELFERPSDARVTTFFCFFGENILE
jgi:hypothetical protein